MRTFACRRALSGCGRTLAAIVLIAVTGGCGRVHFEVEPAGDAGPRSDAAIRDAAADGSAFDAGARDGGADATVPFDASVDASPPPDAEARDAGAIDAGTIDAGPLDAGPPDAGPPDAGPPNVVFVTPPVLTGNLGGLSGADATCASYASSAGLTGTFVAFLSTSSTSAIARLGAAQGWVRPDGRPVALSRTALGREHILYPPVLEADGTRVPPNSVGQHPVFTGTLGDGTAAASMYQCADWTSITTGSSTLGGEASAGSAEWSAGLYFNCATPASIYCFQTDHTTPLPALPPPTGRIVFLATWSPSYGTTPDAACASAASGASLPGTYHAFIATAAASAASRFTLTRWPWVRPDGAIVFQSMSDLMSNAPLAPIAVMADGSYPTVLGIYFTGAVDPFSTAGNDCSDWTNSSGTSVWGHGDLANTDWFHEVTSDIPCNYVASIFCLQD